MYKPTALSRTICNILSLNVDPEKPKNNKSFQKAFMDCIKFYKKKKKLHTTLEVQSIVFYTIFV